MLGAKLGLVDYISRNPFAKAKKVSVYDEHFVVATISKSRDSSSSKNAHCTEIQRHVKVSFTLIFCKSAICAANTNFNKKQFTT